MATRLVPYSHFLAAAARLRWDDAAIDLRADATSWRELDSERRGRVATFIASFLLAESRVAADLTPFIEAAPDPAMAACFQAQATDEERHARFFDRYVTEVLDGEIAGGEDQLAGTRALVDPAFARLFEERLRLTAERLRVAKASLSGAVALYHLILEGIVLATGQRALLAELDAGVNLPGLGEGLTRVIGDERWHVGLGVRVLQESALDPQTLAQLRADGERAIAAWEGLLAPVARDAAIQLHRRRLRAAGLRGE